MKANLGYIVRLCLKTNRWFCDPTMKSGIQAYESNNLFPSYVTIASVLPSVSFCFLICKMEVIRTPTSLCGPNNAASEEALNQPELSEAGSLPKPETSSPVCKEAPEQEECHTALPCPSLSASAASHPKRASVFFNPGLDPGHVWGDSPWTPALPPASAAVSAGWSFWTGCVC